MLLVLLRISIGWHFLYEGIWKYTNPRFSAAAYLQQARGPFAPSFYAMIPDYRGEERLRLKRISAANVDPPVREPALTRSWENDLTHFVQYYKLNDKQRNSGKAILDERLRQVREYLSENRSDIDDYFRDLGSLDQGSAEPADADQPRRVATRPAPFIQERAWQKRSELMAQARTWLDAVDGMRAEYHKDLRDLLTEEQKDRGYAWQPLTQLDWMNLSITYGVVAIGFCLIAGLFTRLACLGGAAFLLLIVLAQPALPGIYPPAPASAGHSLYVNKEAVEMAVLLALSATHVGRWFGLDFIIHYGLFGRWFGRR